MMLLLYMENVICKRTPKLKQQVVVDLRKLSMTSLQIVKSVLPMTRRISLLSLAVEFGLLASTFDLRFSELTYDLLGIKRCGIFSASKVLLNYSLLRSICFNWCGKNCCRMFRIFLPLTVTALPASVKKKMYLCADSIQSHKIM